MMIPFDRAIAAHNMHIRGVVHVGAHWGQEFVAYRTAGIRDIIFIEPCSPAYERLKREFGNEPDVVLFNCACSNIDGHQEIYVETRNQGQSNSFLKPKKHLEYYPEVQFMDKERVPVRMLDNLPFTRNKYNMLMMDTQGAELMVLMGANETLKTMDYIYTEVNDQELYENNALVTELDAYLIDFERVETYMVGHQGWGDAIYKRKSLIS